MYRTYWGLRENPFSNTFDPRYFFLTADLEQAVRKFIGVLTENKSAMLLVGPVGSGKTCLCKLIADQMRLFGVRVAHMITPRLDAERFCREVAKKLELSENEDAEISEQQLYDKMKAPTATSTMPPVLILDEAQSIADDLTFEAIRIMLDFDKNGRFLQTLLLAGNDTLVPKLRSNASLNQRLAVRHRLSPFTREETSEYIDFRLKTAGAVNQIFTPAAKQAVYNLSEGLPRTVNAICDAAMVIAADERFLRIDDGLVTRAHEKTTSFN
jgi:type II secretory pathway predicted ATPase ExeA